MSEARITNCGCCSPPCRRQKCGLCKKATGEVGQYMELGKCCNCTQLDPPGSCTPNPDGSPHYVSNNCTDDGVVIREECTAHQPAQVLVTLPSMRLGDPLNEDRCNFAGGTYILENMTTRGYFVGDYNHIAFRCNPYGAICGNIEYYRSSGEGPPFGTQYNGLCSFIYEGYINRDSSGTCGDGGGCSDCEVKQYEVDGMLSQTSKIYIILTHIEFSEIWLLRLAIGYVLGKYVDYYPIGCRECLTYYSIADTEFLCKGINILRGGLRGNYPEPGQTEGCLSGYPAEDERCRNDMKYCGELPTSVTVEVL